MTCLLITLNRSKTGANKNQLACLQALGLNKIGDQVIHENNDAILGICRKISHFITCEEVEVEAE